MTFALGACVGPSIAGVLVDNFNFGWASLFVVVTELTVFVITFSFVGYRYVTFYIYKDKEHFCYTFRYCHFES